MSYWRKVFLLYLVITVNAYATELEVGLVHFPPLYKVDGQDKPSGVLTDILESALVKAGLQYRLASYPPKRMYANLAEGITDLSISLKGPQVYHEHVIYSDAPVYVLQIKLYSRDDVFIPSNLEQMYGHNIGLIKGYDYAGFMQSLTGPDNPGQVELLATHQNAVAMLRKGRLAFLLSYYSAIEDLDSEKYQPKLYSKLIKKVPLHFVISKKSNSAASLMQRLETAHWGQ